jgi:hypothetical protein
MPKKLLQRLMPNHLSIREHRHLQFLGHLLHHPHLWHLNRRSVAGAFSVGMFVAFIPVPFQMVIAAVMAIMLHTNLPISVMLVWISNPVTMPALFYFAYIIGASMLDVGIKRVTFELSIDWLTTSLGAIWEPFLLGCFVLGISSAVLSNILMRFLWRMQVIRNWESRKARRLLEKNHVNQLD